MWAPPKWRFYRKHIPPGTRTKSWVQLVRETAEPGHKGYYHPDLREEIEAYEMACFQAQQLVSQTYPTRYYWAKFDRVVGASRGEETAYLLVEHDASTGDVHGHPVTWDELIGKGVSL